MVEFIVLLAIFGSLTFLSLVTTLILGVLTNNGKNLFNYHRAFAGITILLALSHAIAGIYYIFFK
jgi:hypothetical protein